MNGIDSVSDGSNRIHLNSVVSSVVNSVQAVYSTVLPSSLMIFLYYVSDTFCTFQNGMENHYYWIQKNIFINCMPKTTVLIILWKGKMRNCYLLFAKNRHDTWRILRSVLELILNELKICFAVSRKALNFFQVNFSSVFDVGVFLLAFIMASQCWCIMLIA